MLFVIIVPKFLLAQMAMCQKASKKWKINTLDKQKILELLAKQKQIHQKCHISRNHSVCTLFHLISYYRIASKEYDKEDYSTALKDAQSALRKAQKAYETAGDNEVIIHSPQKIGKHLWRLIITVIFCKLYKIFRKRSIQLYNIQHVFCISIICSICLFINIIDKFTNLYRYRERSDCIKGNYRKFQSGGKQSKGISL